MLTSHGAITICQQPPELSAICSTTSPTCFRKHNFRTYSFELFKNPKYSPHQVLQLCTSSMSSSLLLFSQQALQVCVFYCVISVNSDFNLDWCELFHSSKCSSHRALFTQIYQSTVPYTCIFFTNSSKLVKALYFICAHIILRCRLLQFLLPLNLSAHISLIHIYSLFSRVRPHGLWRAPERAPRTPPSYPLLASRVLRSDGRFEQSVAPLQHLRIERGRPPSASVATRQPDPRV